MTTLYYKQCRLRRSNVEHVAWIPERFAVAGRVLKLRMAGVWLDGWKVLSANGRIDSCAVHGWHGRGFGSVLAGE